MEGPKKISELDAALARLEKNVLEKNQNAKSFETPNGFSASLRFYDNGFTNLTLRHNGQYSVFAVTPVGIGFNELRGLDDELLTEKSLITRHTAEAQLLFDLGSLEKHSSDDSGQYELDI